MSLINRRRTLGTILSAAGASLTAPSVVLGQGLAARQLRIVVPVSPGGGVDTFARLIAAKIQTKHNTAVIVENRTGGNATIGGLEVRRAPPDGTTVLFHASNHAVVNLVLKSPPYDPVVDFTPIGVAGETPLVHIISNNRPEKTVAEIVASAKAAPEKWSFATAQLGAPGHLAAVTFNQLTGIDIPIIAYRGTAPAANDVAGGHVPMMIEAILSLLQLVRGGSVGAVAVTSKRRSSLAPDIPTMTDLGLPALNFGAWWGMWGPPGLPAELTLTLNGLMNEAVKELTADGKLASLGIEPFTETPQFSANLIADDNVRTAQLLKAANFKPE